VAELLSTLAGDCQLLTVLITIQSSNYIIIVNLTDAIALGYVLYHLLQTCVIQLRT